MAGRILLGANGYIYLTDVLYKFGWQATDRLALPEKAAEVAIPVPLDAVPTIQYNGVVAEIPAKTGHSYRRGGGHEWIVTAPIDLPVFPWSWIPLEIP